MEEGEGSLRFLQAIYRNPEVPLPVRMRAASIAIEYELPRLAVTAVVSGGDFADQLERAIERSRRVMIEAKPITNVNASSDDASSNTTRLASNGHKPSVVDRRYRRW